MNRRDFLKRTSWLALIPFVSFESRSDTFRDPRWETADYRDDGPMTASEVMERSQERARYFSKIRRAKRYMDEQEVETEGRYVIMEVRNDVDHKRVRND